MVRLRAQSGNSASDSDSREMFGDSGRSVASASRRAACPRGANAIARCRQCRRTAYSLSSRTPYRSRQPAPGPSIGAATRLHAVHGVEVANGIEVPDHRAVARRIRAQVAVERSGEHRAGNRRHGGRLGRAALRRAPHGSGAAATPTLPSAMRSAVRPPPTLGSSARDVAVRVDDRVGRRRVDALAVAGHAPLHAAVDAALPDARLPDDSPCLSGSKAQTIPAFCPASSRSRPPAS